MYHVDVLTVLSLFTSVCNFNFDYVIILCENVITISKNKFVNELIVYYEAILSHSIFCNNTATRRNTF